MTVAMQAFATSLPMMLYRALNAVMPRFRAIFAAHGLTEPQWRVLRVLWEHDSVAFRTLAEHTLIPPPSLVGVIDRLAANGLVERERAADDRRQVAVSATTAGRELHQRVQPEVEAAYAALDAELSPTARKALDRGLAALADISTPRT